LVVAVLALVGYLVYLLVRWYLRGQQTEGPPGPRTSPRDARYRVEADQTVWSIRREVIDPAGHRHEEVQQIARIDAQSGDVDDQFRATERRAHDRAFLLNSSLSPRGRRSAHGGRAATTRY
jgi:hypothetical protein